jgi:long-chain acyl-CoA synthetase
MNRVWVPQYPSGVAADIDAHSPASLKVLLEQACERYADRIAYRSMGTPMTYRQLEQRSRAFGAWLQQRAGLVSGDRVAIMLPNILQYPIAMYGALRAGFVVVNVNPLYTATELEHQLKDSGAT